jgi:copper chaperone CopZ
MKPIIKTLLFATFILLCINTSYAQKKKETVIIKTSAQCKMCEKRIEDAVIAVNGVLSADLNVGSAEIKVVFNNRKTNAETIRQVISKLGYDADAIKADHDAYHKLPSCCQKPGHQH